jgi:ferrous iron transport protein B
MHYKIAILWNPNAGKTSLFNRICGRNEKITNYPGTTFKVASWKTEYKWDTFEFFDLPGVYCLSTSHAEEKVAADFVKQENVDMILNIVDVHTLKRSLLMSLEIAELWIPFMILYNQKGKQSFSKFIKKIHENLPFFHKEMNVEEVMKYQDGFYAQIKKVGEKKESYENYIINHIYKKEEIPIRNLMQTGISLAKAVDIFLEQNPDTPHMFFEKKRLELLKNIFWEMFYERTNSLSKKIDSFVLHSHFSLPLFFALMYGIFYLTFHIGWYFADIFDTFFIGIQWWLKWTLWDSFFASFITEWLVGWVGALSVFLPNIMILFLCLNILEQSGYLSRIAFILDRYLRKVGVNGKASVSLLMGFWCNVPAIMTLRTLQTMRERIIVAAMIPFMSCNARLPVFVLIISAFFPENLQAFVLFWLYLIGIIVALGTWILLNKTLKPEKKVFILELPRYKVPDVRLLILSTLRPLKHFFFKAGVLILPISIALWLLFSFPRVNGEVVPVEETYAGKAGYMVSYVFAPMDYDWKISTALIAGIAAKEVVVSTLGTIYAVEDQNEEGIKQAFRNDPNLNMGVVLSLLIFILVYTPCMTVIGTLWYELGWKWGLFGVIYPTALAWILALLTYKAYFFFV